MAFYGLHPVGTRDGNPIVLDKVTSTAVALHQYDLVEYDGAGKINVSAAGNADNLGVVMTANDSSGDINASSSVQVAVGSGLLVKADASTDVAPVVGVTYDIVGGTGAQRVNVAGGAAGTLLCIESGVDGDTSMGIYVIQESIFTQ